MSTKDIINRVKQGYTRALYGSTENIHEQMLSDIKYLLNVDKIQELKEDIKEYALLTNQSYESAVKDIQGYIQSKYKV